MGWNGGNVWNADNDASGLRGQKGQNVDAGSAGVEEDEVAGETVEWAETATTRISFDRCARPAGKSHAGGAYGAAGGVMQRAWRAPRCASTKPEVRACARGSHAALQKSNLGSAWQKVKAGRITLPGHGRVMIAPWRECGVTKTCRWAQRVAA
jgi:hypothetical protein